MIGRTKDACSVLLAVSGLLVAVPLHSQATQASPAAQGKAAEPAKKAADPGAKADPKADKPAGKAENNPGKAGDKPGKADEKGADQTVNAVQKKEAEEAKAKARVERRKTEEDAERNKIMAATKGQPMSEALRQEMTQHARRLARLERIKAVATDAKDNATILRVTKLIAMENERHDKFAANAASKDEKAGAK
jgi:hypothetical protein